MDVGSLTEAPYDCYIPTVSNWIGIVSILIQDCFHYSRLGRFYQARRKKFVNNFHHFEECIRVVFGVPYRH